MSDVFSSVGTRLSFAAGAPATYDEAGFEAKTFALASEAAELPDFGAVAALAQHTPLATGIVAKRRGSLNYGSITIPFALSEEDTGQDVVRILGLSDAGTDATVSVKVEPPSGDIQYFTAQVMSFTSNFGNADAIAMASVQLEIDNEVIFVAP